MNERIVIVRTVKYVWLAKVGGVNCNQQTAISKLL